MTAYPDDTSRPDQNGRADYDPAGEVKAAVSAAGEALAYAGQLVSAKLAGLAYTGKKLAVLAVLLALAGVVGLTMLVVASAMVLIGLAGAIAAVLPWFLVWLGPLLVGGGVLLLTFGGLWFVFKKIANGGREAALRSYRQSLRRQRGKYGHDAFSRSAAVAAGRAQAVRDTPPAADGAPRPDLRDRRAEAERTQRQIDEDFARLTGRKADGNG